MNRYFANIHSIIFTLKNGTNEILPEKVFSDTILRPMYGENIVNVAPKGVFVLSSPIYGANTIRHKQKNPCWLSSPTYGANATMFIDTLHQILSSPIHGANR